MNSEWWLCQCKFIEHNEYTALVQDVGSWKGCMSLGTDWSIWKFHVLYAQFCCEPKTALKIEGYFKNDSIILENTDIYLCVCVCVRERNGIYYGSGYVHTLCTWLDWLYIYCWCNYIPRYLFKQNENIRQHKTSQVCLQLFYGRKLQTGNILGSHQSKWVKKLWFVHTMVLHSVIKKDELPIFTAIWMNSKTFCWLQKSRHTNIYIYIYKYVCIGCMIPFI